MEGSSRTAYHTHPTDQGGAFRGDNLTPIDHASLADGLRVETSRPLDNVSQTHILRGESSRPCAGRGSGRARRGDRHSDSDVQVRGLLTYLFLVIFVESGSGSGRSCLRRF